MKYPLPRLGSSYKRLEVDPETNFNASARQRSAILEIRRMNMSKFVGQVMPADENFALRIQDLQVIRCISVE